MSAQPAAAEETLTTAVRAAVDKIRKAGYSIDHAEFLDGVWCVSAPVLNAHGEARFALAMLVPAARFREQQNELVETITRIALGLSPQTS